MPKGDNQKRGSDNPRWRGDRIAYRSMHQWARKHLATGVCSVCGAAGRTDMANVDHKYRRVLSDYTEMCRTCHVAYDDANGLRSKRLLSEGSIRARRAKTHCVNGHSLEDAFVGQSGKRACRTCHLEHARRDRSDPSKAVPCVCPVCRVSFLKYRVHVAKSRRENRAGPFCSRKCSGTYNAAKRDGRLAEIGCA